MSINWSLVPTRLKYSLWLLLYQTEGAFNLAGLHSRDPHLPAHVLRQRSIFVEDGAGVGVRLRPFAHPSRPARRPSARLLVAAGEIFRVPYLAPSSVDAPLVWVQPEAATPSLPAFISDQTHHLVSLLYHSGRDGTLTLNCLTVHWESGAPCTSALLPSVAQSNQIRGFAETIDRSTGGIRSSRAPGVANLT